MRAVSASGSEPNGGVGVILVDWGTTHVRAWRAGPDDTVDGPLTSNDGLKTVTDGGFQDRLHALISPFLSDRPVSGIALCGMIGARGGWHEAPYAPCPTDLSALADHAVRFTVGDIPALILPGVIKHEADAPADVMRGEETQLLGLTTTSDQTAFTAIMPGTHSKWARIEGTTLTDFATVMTGELYAVLMEHSLLGRFATDGPFDPDAFMAGVARGADHALSRILFSARADMLAGQLEAVAIADYVSGLLIGAECADGLARTPDDETLILVADRAIARRYSLAFEHFGRTAGIASGEEAALSGLKIAAAQAFA